MLLAHGLETALYGALFRAILLGLGVSLASLWQVRSSGPPRTSALLGAIAAVFVSAPLFFIAILALFANDPGINRSLVLLNAAAALLSLVAACASLGLWLSRRGQ